MSDEWRSENDTFTLPGPSVRQGAGVPLLTSLASFRSLPVPRWAKVVRDLWGNKTRSLLVVLSIAIGVFAIGVIAGTQSILDTQFTGSYLGINPAHARINVSAPAGASRSSDPNGFGDDLIAAVARMPEVEDASARLATSLLIKNSQGEWQDLTLYARPDYADLRINLVVPEEGQWPPSQDGIVVERTSLPLLGWQIGDEVQIDLGDGRVRTVRVTGTVHDIHLPPARFAGRAYGYVGFETLERWGIPRQFLELLITVADNADDKAHIEAVVETVKDKVEKGGYRTGSTRVPDPGQSEVQDILDSLFLILTVLGVLALLLSGFLVINTIAAVLAQQIRQVGVMKTVGARTDQIVTLYFGKALIFGVLSLVIAIPLGIVGAYALARYAASFLNFDVLSGGIAPSVLVLQVIVGILLPVAAAAVPILAGARVTVREAISTYGLGKGRFGQGPMDRLMVHTQRYLPLVTRPVLISLRNTFRRKARLILTMIALTLGGAIFIAVFSVQLSLNNTLEDAYRYDNYDLSIGFDRAYRTTQIQQVAAQVPQVTAVETWGYAGAARKRPDDSVGDLIRVRAPEADTAMIQPTVLAGRWLLPEDESAIVVNSSVLDEESDIGAGDEVTLQIGGKDTTWTVVGIVQSVLVEPTAYVNYPYYAQLTGSAGRANFARISIEPDDPATQLKVAATLEARFEDAGYQVSGTETVVEERESVRLQFGILVTFLLVMALLIAAVGGMALMGTMSINVLERTREIGVLRAIGASDGSVLQIVLVEGVLIGLISWVQGALLALPIGMVMSRQIGLTFVDSPLSYGYSLQGLLIWLAAALIISAVASYLPARTAINLTVREVLSYE